MSRFDYETPEILEQLKKQNKLLERIAAEISPEKLHLSEMSKEDQERAWELSCANFSLEEIVKAEAQKYGFASDTEYLEAIMNPPVSLRGELKNMRQWDDYLRQAAAKKKQMNEWARLK